VSIVFKKIAFKSQLLNPLKGFSLDEIPFEIRFDPLTGETGRVYNFPYKAPEQPDREERIQRSREMFCPFCPEALENSTPLFPKDFIAEGRINKGAATLIPNLVPFDSYAAVAIISNEHYLGMPDLTPERLNDGFSAALAFIRRVANFDPEVRFFYLNWNYMPESGSSLVHPHLQVNCGSVPTNHHRTQIEGCARYLEEHGKSFWADYMSAEKEAGERFIGEWGGTFWTLTFVPQTFLPDVWCIFPEHHSLVQLETEDLGAYLQGLSKVLQYFHLKNIPAFNMSIFSLSGDDDFRINARICPRLLPRPIGNSDRAYMQTLHRESYTVMPPESLCSELREAFDI
jgi:UDPglucose--hexose-1-phosphate uridylyltransferase